MRLLLLFVNLNVKLEREGRGWLTSGSRLRERFGTVVSKGWKVVASNLLTSRMDQHLFEAGASSGIPLRGYIQHKVAALVILKRRRRRTTLLFDYSSLISLYILSESRDDGSPVDLYDNTSQTGASVDAEEFFSFDFFTVIPCINRVGMQHYKL